MPILKNPDSRVTVNEARTELRRLARFRTTCCMCGIQRRNLAVVALDLVRMSVEFRVCGAACAYDLGRRTHSLVLALNR